MNAQTGRWLRYAVWGIALACTPIHEPDAAVGADDATNIARRDGVSTEGPAVSATAGVVTTAGNDGNSLSGAQGGVAACAPAAESCDALDNDCDGRVDEELSSSCGAPEVGDCRPGSMLCAAGQWSPCSGAVGPASEVCDADMHDEDCDGQKNEGCTCRAGDTQPCGSGPCQGTQHCEGGQWSGACVLTVEPRAEVCDSMQVDENCDGRFNEGCECIEGLTEACPGAVQGECKTGARTCARGKWSACEGVVTPKSEVCDSLDNDCNGTVDDRASCATGTHCAGGRCVECTFDTECNKLSGACTQGYCEPSSMKCRQRSLPDRSPCAGGICRSGTCFDGCIVSADCAGSDQTCVGSRCTVVPQCGNGRVESGEQCENGNLGESCRSLGYDGGSLNCRSCRFDFSQCYNNDPGPSGGSGG